MVSTEGRFTQLARKLIGFSSGCKHTTIEQIGGTCWAVSVINFCNNSSITAEFQEGVDALDEVGGQKQEIATRALNQLRTWMKMTRVCPFLKEELAAMYQYYVMKNHDDPDGSLKVFTEGGWPYPFLCALIVCSNANILVSRISGRYLEDLETMKHEIMHRIHMSNEDKILMHMKVMCGFWDLIEAKLSEGGTVPQFEEEWTDFDEIINDTIGEKNRIGEEMGDHTSFINANQESDWLEYSDIKWEQKTDSKGNEMWVGREGELYHHPSASAHSLDFTNPVVYKHKRTKMLTNNPPKPKTEWVKYSNVAWTPIQDPDKVVWMDENYNLAYIPENNGDEVLDVDNKTVYKNISTGILTNTPPPKESKARRIVRNSTVFKLLVHHAYKMSKLDDEFTPILIHVTHFFEHLRVKPSDFVKILDSIPMDIHGTCDVMLEQSTSVLKERLKGKPVYAFFYSIFSSTHTLEKTGSRPPENHSISFFKCKGTVKFCNSWGKECADLEDLDIIFETISDFVLYISEDIRPKSVAPTSDQHSEEVSKVKMYD